MRVSYSDQFGIIFAAMAKIAVASTFVLLAGVFPSILLSADTKSLTGNQRNAIFVASASQALGAIRNARPGDTIIFVAGTYRFSGRSIRVDQPGTAQARIVVRAEQAATVKLEFDMLEGFHVLVPYWTFENLDIRGVCIDHSDCEHAFHIVGQGQYFVARNNTLNDFNAHFKINGADGNMPDHGVLDGNTLGNSGIRQTGNPVTPIDLVAASDWQITRNRISDFIKQGSNQVSYGAFVKGAGSHNRFERNVVICEQSLRDFPGSRVGLSLGGGGTSPESCRDKQCAFEQDNGIIQSNLIASCSDVGIYLNRAANSLISHNTLIGTSGIDVRFSESSAIVEGNLLDGVIRSRNGGVLKEIDNYLTGRTHLYLDPRPVRDPFRDASQFDLAWKGDPPRRHELKIPPVDLCDGLRPTQPTYGAFEEFSVCKGYSILTKP